MRDDRTWGFYPRWGRSGICPIFPLCILRIVLRGIFPYGILYNMPGRKSKSKGKRGEDEAAELLSDIFGVPVKRGHNKDLDGLDDLGVHAEVKRDERTVSASLRNAMEQSIRDAGKQVPIVITRRNYQKEWFIVIRASDLKRLIEICTE